MPGTGTRFRELFDLHRDRVFRHAWGLAGNRQDAEDVIASAFLSLWRLRQRVRLVDGSVLPWLLATTTNIGLMPRDHAAVTSTYWSDCRATPRRLMLQTRLVASGLHRRLGMRCRR